MREDGISSPTRRAICTLSAFLGSALRARSRARELGTRPDLELSKDAPHLIGNSANFRAANASNLSIRFPAKKLRCNFPFGFRQVAEVARVVGKCE
jgi:hypothetical protein